MVIVYAAGLVSGPEPPAGAGVPVSPGGPAGLLPQGHHGHPYRRRERIGVRVPHPFQQLLARDHTAAGLEELFEEAELLAGEVERLTRAGDGPLGLIQYDVGRDEHGWRGGRGSATQRTHPGD
jgi:hypothetical protein